VKPTRLSVLLVVAVGAGIAAYFATRATYTSWPRLPSLAPFTLAFVACAEVLLALSTRNRLAHKPGTQPVDPIAVARYAALAKASSLVGALAAGAYAGIFIHILPLRDAPNPHDDAVVAGVGVIAGVALVIAAYTLEHVCRVKPPKGPPPVPSQGPSTDA
jgi:hypothetical protein